MSLQTTKQISRRWFPNPKKAAERMARLARAGYVHRFPSPLLDPVGRPSFVYTTGSIPRSYAGVQHRLLTSEISVLMHEWLTVQEGISGAWLWPAQIRLSGPVIPDGAFVLSKLCRSLLYFVELDRGTEGLTGRGYTFREKLLGYADYFDSGTFTEDLRGHGDFQAFRVLIIAEHAGRAASLQALARETAADFALVRILSDISPESFPTGWMSLTGSPVNLFERPSQ